ncbi:MAG: PQQ-binding-like beta-propeller repeat protein [Acidobacteriota bacterium]
MAPWFATPLSAQDWPRWLGPNGDGSVVGGGVFDEATPRHLREAWRREIGSGYAALSVVAGRAYTLESDDTGDYALALDASTGSPLWRSRIEGPGAKADDYTFGILSTPTVDHGQVFALGPNGRFQAFRTEDGQALWSHDLATTFAANPPSYGISTSPLVVDQHVVVLVGGLEAHNLVAFERGSGKVAWSVSHARLGSYASPVLATLHGERQIVVPAGDRLYAVHPADGRQLWSYDGLSYPDRSPLVLPPDRIFMPLDETGVLVRVQRIESTYRAEASWRAPSLKNSYSPAVSSDGAIFGFSNRGLLCLDAASGEVLWQHDLGGTHILVDSHLVILSHMTGRLVIAPASREGFRESLSTQAFAEFTIPYTPPSFSDGRIFLRDEGEIVAFELADGPAPEPIQLMPADWLGQANDERAD